MRTSLPSRAGGLPGLADFERVMLGTSVLAGAVAHRTATILGAEGLSEWGTMRAEMCRRVMSDENQIKPEGRAAAKKTVQEWLAARRGLAGHIAWETASINPGTLAASWEKHFFEYTEAHPNMAGLWGFMIIAVKDVSPRLTTHTIPEDGFIHYAEATGFSTQSGVRHIFSSPAAAELIEAVCPDEQPQRRPTLEDFQTDEYRRKLPGSRDWRLSPDGLQPECPRSYENWERLYPRPTAEPIPPRVRIRPIP